ncbi:outer membrane beta-barrel protein [Aestuariivirga sp.]|uniref:outer membrane beta-barrel protein n=1 Tax=Aestuariivirga sp. TaxID=2650926 RepID=UPI00391BC32E
MKRGSLQAAVMSAALMAGACGAFAQEPPQLRGPADEGGGLAIGGLRLHPALGIEALHSSNPEQSPSDPQAALGLRLRPALAVESEWVRHAFTAGVAGDFTRYPQGGSTREQSLAADARLRLDVRRSTALAVEASYLTDTPPDEGDVEHTVQGRLGLSHDLGVTAVKLEAGVLRQTYADEEDAGDDAGDRDYVEPVLSLRVRHGSGMLRPFIEGEVAPRWHDEPVDPAGYHRDSQGYAVTGGFEIAADPVWSGELGLTWLHRRYQDQQLGSASALGLAGAVAWSPTELTRIMITAATAIDDEDQEAGEGGNPVWTAGIEASHGLRENLAVDASLSLEIDGRGSAADLTYEGGVEMTWKLNPLLAWTAGYDLTWLDAAMSEESYVEHRLSAGVVLSR